MLFVPILSPGFIVVWFLIMKTLENQIWVNIALLVKEALEEGNTGPDDTLVDLMSLTASVNIFRWPANL